jgi:hypothetical protein
MDESSESAIIVTTTMQQSIQSQPRPLKTKSKYRSTPAISSMLRTSSETGGRFLSK